MSPNRARNESGSSAELGAKREAGRGEELVVFDLSVEEVLVCLVAPPGGVLGAEAWGPV